MSGPNKSGIGGKSAVEMGADEAAWRDQMRIATSCALCRWKFKGTAAEGRDAAAAHRADKHPELDRARKRRSRGGYKIRNARGRGG